MEHRELSEVVGTGAVVIAVFAGFGRFCAPGNTHHVRHGRVEPEERKHGHSGVPAQLKNTLLPTLQPVSAVQTAQKGGKTNNFDGNAVGDIWVDVRRDWGASLTFWGQQAAGSNKLDTHGTRREVESVAQVPGLRFYGV